MLDKLIRGFEQGRGTHKDYRRNGFGFEEHKEFVSHVESEGGHFDRQARYDHRMRLPANHGRPPMAHMTSWEEDEESDVEYFESSQSHHSNNHHQQPPHLNFMPAPPMAQPHHNGKMGNGWQGRHEDAFHGIQQNHGGHKMQKHQGGHEMQMHQGGHEMQQHHDGHGMQQNHGGHKMQKHQGGHEMQMHHGGHEMQQHHDGHGMQQRHDRLMTPHAPPSHVFMNPIHCSGDGRTAVVKTTEKWQVSGGHRKLGWGSKGL